MRGAYNDQSNSVGLRGCEQFSRYADAHTREHAHACTRHSEVFDVGVQRLETEIQRVSTALYWKL